MSIWCLPGVPLRWARLPSHQLPPSFHVPAHLWGVLPYWNSRGQHANRGKWLRIQTNIFLDAFYIYYCKAAPRVRGWVLAFSMAHRSRCPPSATTAPGWSRRWPDSRSALTSSAACVRSARPTCWLWRPTQQAATSCRPLSPRPAIKDEAKSSRDWRYEGSLSQKLYLQCGAKTTNSLLNLFLIS